jgi:hypothetical protein
VRQARGRMAKTLRGCRLEIFGAFVSGGTRPAQISTGCKYLPRTVVQLVSSTRWAREMSPEPESPDRCVPRSQIYVEGHVTRRRDGDVGGEAEMRKKKKGMMGRRSRWGGEGCRGGGKEKRCGSGSGVGSVVGRRERSEMDGWAGGRSPVTALPLPLLILLFLLRLLRLTRHAESSQDRRQVEINPAAQAVRFHQTG